MFIYCFISLYYSPFSFLNYLTRMWRVEGRLIWRGPIHRGHLAHTRLRDQIYDKPARHPLRQAWQVFAMSPNRICLADNPRRFCGVEIFARSRLIRSVQINGS